MKVGTENKAKLYAAVMLAVVAVLTVAWALIPHGSESEAPVPAAAPTTTKTVPPSVESLDPRLHLDLLASSEDVKYEGKGKNIFRTSTEMEAIERIKVPPRKSDQMAMNHQVYVPPPPPPITLKYFGNTNTKGEKPKAFLSQGEDVWIAHEGDVVNRHYKVVRISPREVEVEDLLNNHRENIPLTQG
jgi:hypothetical protein